MGGNASFLHSYHRAGPGRYAGGEAFNIQNLRKADGEETKAAVAAAIRESIGAGNGNTMVSADAAQIEARVLSWWAGQDDLHDDFARGKDIYSEFASTQFHREVRKPTLQDPPELKATLKRYSQVGKTAVLGLGYNMGAQRFLNRLKESADTAPLFADGVLTPATVAGIVAGYRERYPRIPALWAACDEALRAACAGRGTDVRGVLFTNTDGDIFVRLPSGRRLVYPKPVERPATFESRSYLDRFGTEQSFADDRPRVVTAAGEDLYGGKMVENVTQAMARDVLVTVIHRMEVAGYPVYLHCHDSVTAIVPDGKAEECRDFLLSAWRTVPAWATGLVLDAEASVGKNMNEV